MRQGKYYMYQKSTRKARGEWGGGLTVSRCDWSTFVPSRHRHCALLAGLSCRQALTPRLQPWVISSLKRTICRCSGKREKERDKITTS